MRGRGLAEVARLAGLVAIVLVFVQQAAGGMCQGVAGRVGVAEAELLREHLPDLLHRLGGVRGVGCKVARRQEAAKQGGEVNCWLVAWT